ncbi:hypothetical protein [Cellulomonas rhizosphaerae]|uniref:Uncharacterized protein n=1 Tax=Cellulomonas rhizosphaerae TaxID=2293719 RepID=A0A413RJE8_9CELL|nr:hypothetical protein [Cellulomonas rhizosphaerae]RHA38713.1 hypothetical protein D1825_13345 [Cellulomonas rhizosphaerae]
MTTTIEYLRDLIAGHDRGEWTADQVVEQLRAAVAPERLEVGRSFRDLQTTGLLWYLNRTALWPRGLALALYVEAETGLDDGVVLGWDITGDGVDPITSDGDERAKLAAVEQLFALATYDREAGAQ